MLEIQGVDQVFRSGFWLKPVQVLHSIDLSVPEKSVFGFLGANGAGKTTLIHLIVGLRKPTRGSIKVAGYEATTLQARKEIGYLPERPYFYEHLTGNEMLKYFGTLSGISRSAMSGRIAKVLSLVGLKEARHVELGKYSKGMLQRIGIAQAILHDPSFLVLDEPMSGLDPLGRKEVRELIRELAQRGKTIFFSSHVIPDVEAICDQVGLVQKGRLIGKGPIGQFLSQGPLQTEIGFSGVDSQRAKEFSNVAKLFEIPGGMKAIVPGQEQVTIVLKKLLEMKGQVLWVTPIRPSLEALFDSEESV